MALYSHLCWRAVKQSCNQLWTPIIYQCVYHGVYTQFWLNRDCSSGRVRKRNKVSLKSKHPGFVLKGCVFDLPSDCDAIVAEKWQDGRNDTLKKATELPDLVEQDFTPDRRGSGSGGRGGFQRGGRFQSNGRGGNAPYHRRSDASRDFNRNGMLKRNAAPDAASSGQNKKMKFN